ncbi:MAG: hypothetical protein NZ920_05860 [Aigarchaeota archaeon]|nr:hypothetical protein [Aigarchaeota archaeon]MDW8092632.1 hypothetical protein [Nitrososphaerota archaeon]
MQVLLDETYLLIAVGTLTLISMTFLFIDGVESLASRKNLTRFATGALLAAVLTALPETIIALTSPFHSDAVALEIGIGSVLAAPSMTLFIGVAIVGLSWRRVDLHKLTRRQISVNYAGFMAFISIALIASMLPPFLRFLVGISLILGYVAFARHFYLQGGERVEEGRVSYFERVLDRKWTGLILMQVLMASILMVIGANAFISGISRLTDPFTYSLLVSPFATCLEELVVAIFWMIFGKHDISLSLLSGENLTQSTLVMGLASIFTGWDLPESSMYVFALYWGAGSLYIALLMLSRVRALTLGFAFYAAYFLISLSRVL